MSILMFLQVHLHSDSLNTAKFPPLENLPPRHLWHLSRLHKKFYIGTTENLHKHAVLLRALDVASYKMIHGELAPAELCRVRGHNRVGMAMRQTH